jgi:type IV secretory pathway VirB9-like protein
MNPCIRHMLASTALLLVAASPESAQQSAQQPAQQQAVPIIRRPSQKDYADASRLLTAAQQRRSKANKPATPLIMGTINSVPGDRPLILPESAIRAIQMEAEWRNTQAMPMIGGDGRILYVYGHGQPNIPVAPGKICTIEFAVGEALDDSGVEIGDSERWKLARHQVMQNGQVQAFLTISPRFAGLDTPLTVFTASRVYYFRLLSDSTGYIERAGFTYPDEERLRREERGREAEHIRQVELAAAAAEEARKKELALLNTNQPLRNFHYAVQVSNKHSEFMRPISVGDNGYHTKIVLSDDARHRDHPALRVLNHYGPDTPNVHYDESTMTYTVDGTFETAELTLGSSHKRSSVTITNLTQKK